METKIKRIGFEVGQHRTCNVQGQQSIGRHNSCSRRPMVYYRSISPDMASAKLNWVSVGALAALFLAAAVWLAFERQPLKPIPADEFVRAMETHQTSLIDRYFRERQNPNARAANDRSLLFAAFLREDRDLARRLIDSGASPDLCDDAG